MHKINKFAETMSNRSYEELLEIVGKLRNDYQPEAILAAEAELKNRKPPIEIIELEEKKGKKKKETESLVDIANEPLEVNMKIYSFLLPHPRNLLTAYDLKTEGYVQQAKDTRQWTYIGCATYLIIFILIILISVWIS